MGLDGDGDVARTLCLHPYRKRKFFMELAELLEEPTPPIRRLQDVFPPRSVDAKPVATESSVDKHTQESTSAEDSFECIEFERSRCSLGTSRPSQSQTQHDSMQDSLLFLPPELRHDHDHEEEDATPSSTITVLTRHVDVTARRTVELLDYFDLDRYCESTPCWVYQEQTVCPLHTEPIRRPMLLFCLQSLDEFIAFQNYEDQDASWLVQACRLARAVFAKMWEADVLNRSADSDLELTEYTAGIKSMPGVSLDVWRVIEALWDRHKQNFLHQQELFFADSITKVSTSSIKWRRAQQLFHVFGMKQSQVLRLMDQESDNNESSIVDSTGRIHLNDKQLEVITHGFPSSRPVAFGLRHLKHTLASRTPGAAEPIVRRDLVSQSEWKVAFRAIEVHLKKWSRGVQLFPCGSFSRGAAFGSVIDVLVGTPEEDVRSSHESGSMEGTLDQILQVLMSAGIVTTERVERLTQHRALATIAFKNVQLVLDLKVYQRPQSWFALLYYTGPERFAREYFTSLLQRPLYELDSVTFDSLYDTAIRSLGHETTRGVDSEMSVFDLVEWEYQPPSQRF
ncbi:hypothetical protein Poli38472_002101 [Pythium oligandrum]|uniref:DNA polymerase n=1 Tax=Pythium oligandrum TaxID=41045 RepID=A0A8K1CH69_PYTOL|nr:hypothetical protein Poli38472_002101 [Pythium oligandrum]|eukprot:TMW63160.1 hypothetical protein Poli38472_002101 [Pythium oligandrum]